MWKWDQGRMQYFQYDALRTAARFIVNHDLKNSEPKLIREVTELDFSAPPTHSPWRNYSRIYKLCLLVSEIDGHAVPTEVAQILSQDGLVTCDEYIHFLVEATTDPSPALSDWRRTDVKTKLRSPLCFSLKYILAKAAGLNEHVTSINEIIGAYRHSGFTGEESDEEYLGLMRKRGDYSQLPTSIDPRQARESIKFISQISYLYNTGSDIIVSLNAEDAREIFHSINPITGPKDPDGSKEIQRLAGFFRDGSDHDFFNYESTVLLDTIESGFTEGSKVKKTHIVIERNSNLRRIYFDRYPNSTCDACTLDTNARYPWVERVLDLHHVLPLSSGTRVDSRNGTMLEDLTPVCPTCHRAIHRYYDNYLRAESRKDFNSEREAHEIYAQAKSEINRSSYHA